ncbi:Hypothetical protein KVN_LOCUS531 [uncultured virus]|nr:Hypothetical protein KVN_LOCUS531 [uncultured virus]
MKKVLYCLIDNKIIPNEIYKSKNFELVLHEYLSKIEYLSNFLLREKISNNLEMKTFDNLLIIKKIEDQKKYFPFIMDIYQLNLQNWQLNSKYNDSSIIIPNKIQFHCILNKIKSNIGFLNKKQINKSEICSSEMKNLINETKDIIQSMNTNTKSKKNLKIPDSISIDDDEENNICIEEIKKEINELEKIKELEKNKITNIQEKYNEDLNKYNKNFIEVHNKKKKLNKEKEKLDEKKRIYESDKRAYFLLKKEIIEGKISEEKLPIYIINKYPIFKFMEKEKIFDNGNNEFEIFQKLFDELYPTKINKKNYIPHNINFSTTGNNDFMNGQPFDKTYPSLEEILDNLECSIENDDNDEEEFDKKNEMLSSLELNNNIMFD